MDAKAADFSLSKTTKDKLPALPFFSMKRTVLGKTYDLSLVIVGDDRARSLNRQYRKKNYVPNVLSFPLDKRHGEIFLNLREAKRQHRSREESFDYFVALLVIHAMLHLKGARHGSTMESAEERFLSKFNIKNTF